MSGFLTALCRVQISSRQVVKVEAAAGWTAGRYEQIMRHQMWPVLLRLTNCVTAHLAIFCLTDQLSPCLTTKKQINNAAWPFTASDKLSVIPASSNKNARPYLTVFQTVCFYLSLFVDPERLLLRYLGFLLWKKIKETVWAYKLVDSAHKYDTTWTLRFIWRFSSVWLIED